MAGDDKNQTANEALFDETIRRQIALRRFTAGEVARIEALLDRAQKDLLALLLVRLDRITATGRGRATQLRLEKLLKEVAAMRKETWASVSSEITSSMRDIAKDEARHETMLIDDAVPIKLEVGRPPLAQVAAAAMKQPLQGRLLGEWYNSLEQADRRRISEAVRLGVVEGQKADEIVRRIRGTRGAGFEDGALAASKRDMTAVVRTAVSGITTAAREAVWEANSDILSGLRWTSVLDGRTSAICRARDGKIFPVGSGPRPPAHVNCRSVMVPVLDGAEIVGSRPTVVDTRTRQGREVDFRKEAKRTGKSVQSLRDAWAKENVGSTPTETTYTAFLKRQSAAFQDDVLGKAKGRLFRQGGLDLDAFVDRAGNELTLTQLKAQQPDAWRKAFGTE